MDNTYVQWKHLMENYAALDLLFAQAGDQYMLLNKTECYTYLSPDLVL